MNSFLKYSKVLTPFPIQMSFQIAEAPNYYDAPPVIMPHYSSFSFTVTAALL